MGRDSASREGGKRFISIDFGQAFTKIAVVEVSDQGYKLVGYDLKRIPPGKENKPDFVAFINDFLKTHAIREKKAYLTIFDPEAMAARYLTLAVLPRQEILGAIQWQLKGELPFDLEAAFSDWRVVREFEEGGTKKNEVLFIAAKKSVVEEYLSIAHDSGLEPIVVTSAPFNYANIISYIEREDNQLPAVLDISSKGTTLCVFRDNVLSFIRDLPFSAERLISALAGTLNTERGKLEISQSKAEEIIKNYGVLNNEQEVLSGDIHAADIIPLMRHPLERLVRELKRSFEYFTTNFKESRSPILYLTGGGANLKNLKEYLAETLNIKVAILDLPKSVNTEGLAQDKVASDKNQLINVIGAAMVAGEPLNLLPRDAKAEQMEMIKTASFEIAKEAYQPFLKDSRLRIIALGLAASFILFAVFFNLNLSALDKRLETRRASLDVLRQTQAEMSQAGSDMREQLFDAIHAGSVPVDGMLKVISNVIPHNIVISSINFKQSTHSLVIEGQAFEETGSTESSLATFMEDIEASAFFTEASLLDSKKDGRVQEFDIECDLAH